MRTGFDPLSYTFFLKNYSSGEAFHTSAFRFVAGSAGVSAGFGAFTARGWAFLGERAAVFPDCGFASFGGADATTGLDSGFAFFSGLAFFSGFFFAFSCFFSALAASFSFFFASFFKSFRRSSASAAIFLRIDFFSTRPPISATAPRPLLISALSCFVFSFIPVGMLSCKGLFFLRNFQKIRVKFSDTSLMAFFTGTGVAVNFYLHCAVSCRRFPNFAKKLRLG